MNNKFIIKFSIVQNRLKLSIPELSEKIGFSAGHIYKVLEGKRKVSLELADSLNVLILFIFGSQVLFAIEFAIEELYKVKSTALLKEGYENAGCV